MYNQVLSLQYEKSFIFMMLKEYKFVIVFISLFVTVNVLDSGLTRYLVVNVLGEEANPFVDTSSLWTLLFSPMQFVYLVVCIGTVVLSERDRDRTTRLVKDSQFLLFLSSLPYFYLVSKTLAIVNNAGIAVGIGGVISWFLNLFEGDDFLGLAILYTLLAMVTFPLCERFVRYRYAGARAKIQNGEAAR